MRSVDQLGTTTQPSDVLATLKSGVYGKLDTQLAALYADTVTSGARSLATNDVTSLLAGVRSYTNAITTGSDGKAYVVIDATASNGNGAALLAELNTLGLQHGSSYGSLASGLMPVTALGSLSGLTDLAVAHESGMSVHAGLVDSQADVALQAQTTRATYDVTGSGLKIGVLSDSFDTSDSTRPDGMRDTLATDIASGDLPKDTTILEDFKGGEDEGRGMAQQIHDIAPGTAIEFATAYTGMAGFANNIVALANDGAKVIVDDVLYYEESAYQDGVIAQAVDRVATKGVSYFSSAGNDGFEGYESKWYDGGLDKRFDGHLLEFAPGQTALPFVASGYDDVFILQWDQPAASAGGPGSKSDLDFFLTDASGNTVYTLSASNNIGNDPVEGFDFEGVAGETYYLRISLDKGPTPGLVKIMALGNGSGVDLGTTGRNINTGTIYGHAAAHGANAVGAAYYLDTPAYGTSPAQLEDYSSGGPTRIAFDPSGHRLASVEVRDKPTFTSVDGADTTFFGFDTHGDPDSYPNFFGTSAAAPNAAAVALLMLQANPNLTNADITALLKSSALDMEDPDTPGFDRGYDFGSGSGLIQADMAIKFAKTGTIENATATELYGTHLKDTINGNKLDNTIDGGAGNDRVSGGDGNDVLTGGDGNDHVFGNLGNDRVDGGNGDDTLSGGAGKDFLRGQAGDDILMGDKGNDTLLGGDGKDFLIGGPGTDTLTGGDGADKFVFAPGDSGIGVAADTITDFSASVDRIDLTAIYAAGGTYSLSTTRAGDIDIIVDANGHGKPDFNIHVHVIDGTFSASDILFT